MLAELSKYIEAIFTLIIQSGVRQNHVCFTFTYPCTKSSQLSFIY